jgi:putative tryptophan/tyrosine transport system substrate-binding protein
MLMTEPLSLLKMLLVRHTRRRDLLIAATLVGGSPAAAQQAPTSKRLGWLARDQVTSTSQIFIETLGRLGWVEGKSLVIDRRFAVNRDSYARASAELVALRPDAVVGVGAPDVEALLAVTRTVPIIFATVSDPVTLGFVKSLSRPGGNVTGITSMTPDLELKQIELIHELLPGARRISTLRDRQFPGSEMRFTADEKAALSLGLTLVRRQAGNVAEINAAAAAAADQDDAIHVEFSGLTLVERKRVAELAAQYRLPAIYGVRPYIEAGGLICYGPIYSENFQRAAAFVDKILRGAKPEDLPVEEPTRFELVINSKAAQALGLAVPRSLLARADEVIE